MTTIFYVMCQKIYSLRSIWLIQEFHFCYVFTSSKFAFQKRSIYWWITICYKLRIPQTINFWCLLESFNCNITFHSLTRNGGSDYVLNAMLQILQYLLRTPIYKFCQFVSNKNCYPTWCMIFVFVGSFYSIHHLWQHYCLERLNIYRLSSSPDASYILPVSSKMLLKVVCFKQDKCIVPNCYFNVMPHWH